MEIPGETAKENARALFNELIKQFKETPNSTYRVYRFLISKGYPKLTTEIRSEFEALLPHMFDVSPSLSAGDLSIRLHSQGKLKLNEFTSIEDLLHKSIEKQKHAPIVKRTNLTMSNTPIRIKNELPSKTTKRIIKYFLNNESHEATLFALHTKFKDIDRNHLDAAIDQLVHEKYLSEPKPFSYFNTNTNAFDTVVYHLTEKGERKYKTYWYNGWLFKEAIKWMLIAGGGFLLRVATENTQTEKQATLSDTTSIRQNMQKPIILPNNLEIDTTQKRRTNHP